jgi:hypothetical protein
MEHLSELLLHYTKNMANTIVSLKWEDIRRISLNLGGLLLLCLSLYGSRCLRTGLRVPSFLIGIIALIDVLWILEDIMGLSTNEGMSGSKWFDVGNDPQDSMIHRERNGQGRVYVEPRIPRVSGMGTETVEVRGTPGGKLVYWPSGGLGLGASNDRLHIEQNRNPASIRETALGCGVVMLDERGRGMAMAERGCEHLLYREVSSSGYGGPIGKIRVGGSLLTGDGSRGEKSHKNGMGGMRSVGA